MPEPRSFKDHFSDAPAEYARARPTYPVELFERLRALSPDAATVWDCATGNGQAAVELADRFPRVIANDASAEQLAHAARRPNIDYRVAPAEASGLEHASVDLVTVAQALHWFDHDAFWSEVASVARPDALLAAWCYGLHEIEPAIDRAVRRHYDHVVGAYWTPERAHIDAAYATIDCPFVELDAPRLAMERDWTREDVLAYIATWSATKRCTRETGEDPTPALADELSRLWESGNTKRVRWPLTLRLWRVA